MPGTRPLLGHARSWDTPLKKGLGQARSWDGPLKNCLGQARPWDMPFKLLGTGPLLGQALQNAWDRPAIGASPSKGLGQARSWDRPLEMPGTRRQLNKPTKKYVNKQANTQVDRINAQANTRTQVNPGPPWPSVLQIRANCGHR